MGSKSPQKMILISLFVIAITSTSSSAQTSPPSPPLPLTPTPSPAPAPAPEYVNLTELLTVAGPFQTFLKYLIDTKLIDVLQSQANNTEQGVTIFVPKDSAFTTIRDVNPSLKNMTADQLRQVFLFHALPQYYSLSDFRALSKRNPVSTMAGGGLYALNFTDQMGTVHVSSKWTNTKITSSVHSSRPVSVYQIDKVLLPMAIYGTDVPPLPPAPAPAPGVASAGPAADADGRSPGASPPGRSGAIRAALGVGASGVAVMVTAMLML